MWRNALTYPQCVNPRTALTLDTLESLVPFPRGDRYVAWTQWLVTALHEGLLTATEVQAIRYALAENL